MGAASAGGGGETEIWGNISPFFVFSPLNADADRIYFFFLANSENPSQDYCRKFPGLSYSWSRFLKNDKMVD